MPPASLPATSRLAALLPSGILAALLLASLAAPVLEGLGEPISRAVYEPLGTLCHQRPSRCLFVGHSAMGLCARCLALYSGLLLAAAASLASPRARLGALAGLLLALPCLAHRVVMASQQESAGRTRDEAEQVLAEIMARVAIPL